MSVDQIMKWKRKVEEIREKKARTQGTLETLRERLKADFGADSEKEGRKLLKKFEKEAEAAETEAEEALAKFEEEYGERLS